MGMSEFYGEVTTPNRSPPSSRRWTTGVNFLDTADMYGPFTTKRWSVRPSRERRSEVVLATKFGNERDEDGRTSGINGRPEYVLKACEASLRRLGVDMIDLYYQHRVDRGDRSKRPGAPWPLVEAGKVRHLGISEASSATIERAHAVHP